MTLQETTEHWGRDGREALVEVIAEARGRFTPAEMAWAGNGYHDEDRTIADALLARGLRLPGSDAVAERDEAFAAGQESMRERAALEAERGLASAPNRDGEMMRAIAEGIRDIPIKDSPDGCE